MCDTMEKYLLYYSTPRYVDNSWVGTMDEYEKFSDALNEEFGEGGWGLRYFTSITEMDELIIRMVWGNGSGGI
jgi:hypothetical protein